MTNNYSMPLVQESRNRGADRRDLHLPAPPVLSEAQTNVSASRPGHVQLVYPKMRHGELYDQLDKARVWAKEGDYAMIRKKKEPGSSDM